MFKKTPDIFPRRFSTEAQEYVDKLPGDMKTPYTQKAKISPDAMAMNFKTVHALRHKNSWYLLVLTLSFLINFDVLLQ